MDTSEDLYLSYMNIIYRDKTGQRQKRFGTNHISSTNRIGTNHISATKRIGTNHISATKRIGTNHISCTKCIGTNHISDTKRNGHKTYRLQNKSVPERIG